SKGPSLAFPHIGKSSRSACTALISGWVQFFGRVRRGRRLFGSSRWLQRFKEARLTPTALAACTALRPSRLA
ncbi:MAG: hypothetical protein ACKOEY_04785, partial [Phenylobacterium sp.]